MSRMSEDTQPTPHAAPHDLAHMLAPALRQACGERIGEIRWFQSDWQRGGAATGYAPYSGDNGETEVVIKLPVGPVEYRFTKALCDTAAPTPRLAAHGEELAGYDLAWLVMERLPGDPLSLELHDEVLSDLAHAAAGFYGHTHAVGPAGKPKKVPDWSALLDKARDALRDHDVADSQRWKNAVKHVHRALPILVARWESRAITGWCHGDLHPGNAMRRPENSPWGPACCVLLDLAEVHPGHWVEDAVYLERLYWARPEALHGAKPVKLLAKARKAAGLETCDDYAELANLRRTLVAACVPAFLQREGHPKYVAAALEVLERTLPQVGA